jgi:hypothetical protein
MHETGGKGPLGRDTRGDKRGKTQFARIYMVLIVTLYGSLSSLRRPCLCDRKIIRPGIAQTPPLPLIHPPFKH